MWLRPFTKPLGDEDPNLPMAQGDGDPGESNHEKFLREVQPVVPPGVPKTQREPYPRLISVQQDEMLYMLKAQFETLERRVSTLEELP